MPVTARLSKLLYDRLGDEVVDELVTWFNSVDTAYRTDLREFNEINFSRFDAKLEQRLAEQDARIERRFSEFEAKFDKRLIEFDTKFEKRLTELDTKFEKRLTELDAKFETRLTELDAKFEKRFTELDLKLEKRFAEQDVKFAELRTFMERALKEQTRWMFVAWATLLIPIIGLWMRP